MPSVTIYPPSNGRQSHDSVGNPLPGLLQTPSGLAILELQGSINLPGSTDGEGETNNSNTKVGRIVFPDYSKDDPSNNKAWMKKVYMYVGPHQRLTGEVKKLSNPMAIIRKKSSTSGTDSEELEIADVVYHKIIFSTRPEPSTCLLLIKFFLTAVYNIYFHPLSKFPGPKSAAATPIPFVRRLLYGNWVDWTTKLHEKYGEVVRIHPDELSFIGPSAWLDIFGGRPQLPKPKIGVIVPGNGVPNMGTTNNSGDHARQRRIIGNALSDRALREQEYILKNYSDLLIQRLHEQVKEGKDGRTATADIGRWYTYTTFDTIGDLELGESFHSLDNKEDHPWVSAIFHGLKFGMMLTAFHHFPPLKAEWLLPRIVHKKAREHFVWASNCIDKRLQKDTDRPDFMKYILESSEEKGMSRDEIDSNATFLILAGSDTSATTCTSATWFLVKHPSALKRLQEEVRSSFKSLDDITVATASKLPYLHAAIQEALRLHPTGPISVPREVDRPGTVISGHPVPVGVRVGIPQKTAYRSRSNFVEPLKYRPERWLKDADPKFNADRKDSCEPFMVGPRNCLGKSLAWAEMNLILSKVIWTFDLELGEGTKEDWSNQKIWLLHERAPLYVKLTMRDET